MALTRVQAGIPVIIMGEAGCGKTSMINFAGHLTNANVVSFPLHGGISRHQIEEFLRNNIDNMKYHLN
jgi:ABC-type lipoprotein export system ATPase subunit